MIKESYVYIMTNYYGNVLYTGVTTNLERRVYEHKNGLYKGFTKKYNLTKLVYYETYSNVVDAIEREKQIKNKNTNKKHELITTTNPNWQDLDPSNP